MMLKKYIAIAVVALLGFSACEKGLLDKNVRHEMVNPSQVASLKIIHAYASMTPRHVASHLGPQVFMYWGDQKLNGALLSYAGGAGQWPAPSTVATNARSWYAEVPPGSRTLYGVLGRISATTTPPNLPSPIAGDTLFRLTANLEAGKSYTAFLSDTLPNPSITLVEDRTGEIPNNKYWFRYANFAAWPTDVVEVKSVNENRVLFPAVTYKQVSQFVELNITPNRDTLVLRKVSGGSTFNYNDSLFFTPVSKRAYTFVTRGRLAPTPAATAASAFQNRATVIATNF